MHAHEPPSAMPRCLQMAALISSDPFTMHGVVPQSWIKYLPTRSLKQKKGRGVWYEHGLWVVITKPVCAAWRLKLMELWSNQPGGGTVER